MIPFAVTRVSSSGTFDGLGKLTYANGAVYNGFFKDGEEHGRGEYTFAGEDEWKWEGEWVAGKQQLVLGTRFRVGLRVRVSIAALDIKNGQSCEEWLTGVIIATDTMKRRSPVHDVTILSKYEVELDDDIGTPVPIFTDDDTSIQPMLTESQIDSLWDDDNGTEDTTAEEQRRRAKREKKKRQKQRRRDESIARAQAAQAAKEQRSRDGAEQRRKAELKKGTETTGGRGARNCAVCTCDQRR